jgi:hypothetical protein
MKKDMFGRDVYSKKILTHRILLYQFVGFFSVVIFIWLDEFFDLPRVMFGGAGTAPNLEEATFESSLLIGLWVVTFFFTRRFLNRIRYLEGFQVICTLCKKVRIGNDWIRLEDFLKENSDIQLSHSYCPACSEEADKIFWGTNTKPE